MKKGEAIEKIIEFINFENQIDFDSKIIFLRMLNEIRQNKDYEPQQNLDIVLLKLRYKVKQRLPKRWSSLDKIPTEIEMSKELVENPVSREEIINEGKIKRRPGRTLKALNKWENESKKFTAKKLVVL